MMQNTLYEIIVYILHLSLNWSSGKSVGLALRRSRFNPRQGRPLYMYTPSTVSTFGWICALYKSSYFNSKPKNMSSSSSSEEEKHV
jgi:hypothetical protein